MTVEQLLDKLENDRTEAEIVRHNCYEKVCSLRAEQKDIFKYAYDTDDLNQQLYDLETRLAPAVYDETMACCKLNRIITTIYEIKLRMGQV